MIRSGVPLVRALSKLRLASRTAARTLIADGRVTVDGARVTDPLTRVVPERVRIEIDDRGSEPMKKRLVLFHKPRGVVTTQRDPEGRRTVFDVLGEVGRGLVAVGRLDIASTGLLLFTNDTALANRLTDPTNRVPRTYVVTVRGHLRPDMADRLRGSVASLDVRKASRRETHLIVTLEQGKNREIRRLFDSVGHEVTRLHRISFGAFALGTLQPGAHREVDL